MKLAIIGSRTFTDFELMEKEILRLYQLDQITEIVSGGATGADTLAEMFAQKYNIPTSINRPDWAKYGKRAGYIRNKEIVDQADQVIAFWDGVSRGTKITIDLANRANKRVEIVGVGKKLILKFDQISISNYITIISTSEIDCAVCHQDYREGDRIYLFYDCHHMLHLDCIKDDTCPACDLINQGVLREIPSDLSDCKCPHCCQ